MARKESGRIIGSSRWINADTGEVRETLEIEKHIGRDEHFMIAYLGEIINLIDALGNKKMQVVKFILNNMCKANNTLIMTTREISIKAGVGLNTVIDTLKTLENSGIIQRKTGAIMVSPHLMNNWRKEKEATMMITYKDFAQEQQEPAPEYKEQNLLTGEFGSPLKGVS